MVTLTWSVLPNIERTDLQVTDFNIQVERLAKNAYILVQFMSVLAKDGDYLIKFLHKCIYLNLTHKYVDASVTNLFFQISYS